MTEQLPIRNVMMAWTRINTSFLPFADAATAEMRLPRLLRLSLFQISVGMAMALTVGTLNRVMIVELGVSAALVAIMVSLPLVFAPFRALIGFKSDTHKSALGWRRVPYIWFGTLTQFGGLAIMPFALMVLSGDSGAPVEVGKYAAALAFLMVGAGVQITQTAGLALATDLATDEVRPRVVALMYVMLLVGLFISSFVFSWLLTDFTPLRLIQVVQGAALMTMVLNVIALWKQEARDPARTAKTNDEPEFKAAWRAYTSLPQAKRFLIAIGLGTAAFSMQDILLEPYGGEILGLSVGETSRLTALLGGGALIAYALAARSLVRGFDAFRLAAYGALIGLPGFSAILFAASFESQWLFHLGVCLIGFGSGLFAVATLTAAMGMDNAGRSGLALGAWGSVQATAAGVAMGLGGGLRDVVSALLAGDGAGQAPSTPATAYAVVYLIEIILLFMTLIVIGPLTRRATDKTTLIQSKFGLATLPT
jgi:BCD family chlorophyll transporter-like MFS transporter